MRAPTPPSVEDYAIGCICALSTEAVALRSFLDSVHPCPEIAPRNTSSKTKNSYTTGVMSGHKVVIATLPQGGYGISKATSVGERMLHNFPNLRFCLLVGTGGGAPSLKHDIRLGDVVVSTPVGRIGGVLQYDHGKAIQDHSFQLTQHLDQPPQFLMAAASKLIQDYELAGHPLHSLVDKALLRNPSLKQKYQRPSRHTDRLYHSDVVHAVDSGGDCAILCGDETFKLKTRPLRPEGPDETEIHYGIVASGSSLMKDAHTRDKLAREEEVLCFEMEAAGLMNQLPCMVIRGISNYSDSHKNDVWHGYAAMIASAYTKELLGVLQPRSFQAAVRIENLLQDILSIQNKVDSLKKTVEQQVYEYY